MSRIRRMLTVHTSLGPSANYTLQATVPPNLLSKCSFALPRPHWEPVLYYSIVCIMSFLFFCICLAAYFEGDRIIMADIIRRKLKVSNSTQTFDKGKVFDLRNAAGLNLSPNRSPPSHSSLSSSPMGQQDFRAAAAKSMIHVNGHVEFHSHTNGHKPWLSRMMGMLQLLNPSRLFSSPSKTSVPKSPPKSADSVGSKEPETHPPLTRSNSGKSNSTEPRLSGQQEAISLDKTFSNHVKATKKSKPGKRQLVDSVSISSTGAAQDESSDFKSSKDPSIPSAAKKMAEGEDERVDRSSEAAEDYLEEDISPKLEAGLSARLAGQCACS